MLHIQYLLRFVLLSSLDEYAEITCMILVLQYIAKTVTLKTDIL